MAAVSYRLQKRFGYGSDFVGLEADEFSALREAKENLFLGLEIEERFEYVVGNFREFELTLLEHSLDGMLREPYEWSQLASAIHSFSRRLVNVMTAARLYLDQGDRGLKRIFGEDSVERGILRRERGNEYDSNACFRVMEGLRNYMQHRGLPIRQVTLDRGWDGPECEWRSLPIVHRDFLLADGEFKPIVRKDLEQMDDRIDLRVLLRGYIECLARIHVAVRQAISSPATVWGETITSFIKRFESAHGEATHLLALSFSVDGSEIDRFAIFNDPVELHRKTLHTRSALEYIVRHFVSSRLVGSNKVDRSAGNGYPGKQ